MFKRIPVILLASLAFAAPRLTPAQTFAEQGAAILGVTRYDARSASLADIDNDGDLDLLFQGGVGARQLFRNNIVGIGSMTFTNITASYGPVVPDTEGWSAAWADYDGDGDVDVFLGETNGGSARGDLFRNDLGVRFTDVSTSTGLNDPGFAQNVAWCDVDNDSDLDLIIAMEVSPEFHEIYEQYAPRQFRPIGAQVGIQDVDRKAYGMAVGDYDGDGDNDIYISTCRFGGNIPNHLYRNRLSQTGSLFFDDFTTSAGVQYTDNSYGAEFVDFDDDGDLDLYMVGVDGKPSKLWRNNGDGTFTDVDTLTNHPLLSDPGSDLNGGKAIDYDNDGDLDLFFHDHLAGTPSHARLLYRNDGNFEFTDVTTSTGLASTNEGGFDSTWGDIDRDGDLDLITATDSRFAQRVYVNSSSTNGNHWLFVRLHGTPQNTTAIGAQLYATIHAGTPQERTLRRDANPNAGTFNQSDLPVHFGLGSAAVVDRLRIVWPSGSTQELTNVAADQYLSVTIETNPRTTWFFR